MNETLPTGRILVVDDESGARQALTALLTQDGHEVRDVADGFKAMGALEDFTPDIVLTDLRMPLMNGIELIKTVKETRPQIMCVVMTAFASIETAVDAMKAGADDYLTKPLNFDAVELIIGRCLRQIDVSRELATLREKVQKTNGRPKMIGSGPAMQSLMKLARQVAPSRATILITGESGTGKEVLARFIHQESPRHDQPFVTLHCASLPETLLESELFGHEKGSFTGATNARQGRFEDAHKGTLFLDEIGEISPAMQVKLLRVLQSREFERVGGNRTIQVDTRIIAATNRNLKESVEEGSFREDLYYRLNVINMETPPLRARRSDISLLIRHFVEKFALENDKKIERIDAEAVRILEAYDWPGNVRELENVIERAVVLSEAQAIEPHHLSESVYSSANGHNLGGGIKVPGSALNDIERYAILETYRSTGGDSRQTADILGISQRKVQYKLKEYRD